MKKLLCILLALTLTLSVAAAAVAEAEPLKVTVLVAETLGDRAFNDSADEGRKMLVADYGVDGKVIECNNEAAKFLPALSDAADSADVIVAVGWQFWDPLYEVVPNYPDKVFIFVDNPVGDLGDNFVSIIYADNEGSFLAGYIAMKMSKTGVVGVIGGEDSETINNFIVGYKQGALYANPDGTVLDPKYAGGDYDNPALGKEYALTLYGQGADVVYQVAGKTGLGVFEAAQETGNYAIGVDGDQKYINPDVILCSMVKSVGLSIYDTVAGYITSGELPGGGTVVHADMSNGYISIGYGDDTMTQQVPDELRAEVDELAQKIISGEIVVETTR